MGVNIFSRMVQSLAKTLKIGNETGGSDVVVTPNDKIKSGSGNATINMYFDGSDNSIIISSNLDDASDTYLSLEDFRAFLKGDRSTLSMIRDRINLLYGDTGTSNYPFLSLGANQLNILSLSNYLAGVQNSSAFYIFSTGGAGTDISSRVGISLVVSVNSGITGELTVFKPAVSRSCALGGRGLTLKTSETAYCNQISFQNSGTLFDCILKSGTVTDDREQTLQDKSGTIALLSDTTLNKYVEKWTPYNATLNATWETITIVDAIENSLIEIICVNNNGDNDMGVRMVGSVLNRYVSSVKNSSLTMTVKTDSLKRIQVYASSFGQIDFFFSAQL